jgi:hypothetical protein
MIKLRFFELDRDNHPLDRHCNSAEEVISYLTSLPENGYLWDDYLVCSLLPNGDLDYDFADNLDQLASLMQAASSNSYVCQRIVLYQSQLGA